MSKHTMLRLIICLLWLVVVSLIWTSFIWTLSMVLGFEFMWIYVIGAVVTQLLTGI